MPPKLKPKEARKRTKKPRKIADLPAKSVKGGDAAKVKGGAILNEIFPKIEGGTLKIQQAALTGAMEKGGSILPFDDGS